MNKFLKVKNQTDDRAEIYFYGDIVSSEWEKWEGSDTCPTDVRDLLNELNGTKHLDIYVNSGGGSVFAGLAIYNMLKRNPATKTVYVDGLAGSIASVIALAGDRVVMPSNAFLMIHKPWSGMWGNAHDLRKVADDLDRIEEGILNVYEENLQDGANMDEVRTMVNEETWLTGAEAVKYFKVELAESNEAAACISDFFKNYKYVPKALSKTASIPDPELDEEEEEFNNLLMELELI